MTDIYARALAELDQVDERCRIGHIHTPRVYKLLRALLVERQEIEDFHSDPVCDLATKRHTDAALREFTGGA